MDTEALDMMAESEMGDRIMGEEQQAQSRSASMEKTSYPAEDKKKPSEEKIKKDLEEVKKKSNRNRSLSWIRIKIIKNLLLMMNIFFVK